MVQRGVDGRPHPVEVVVVDADVARAQVEVGVQDRLEPVAVHAPALVPLGDLRQAVGAFEHVAAPEVGVLAAVQVHAGVARALDADLVDALGGQVLPHPARQVLVRGALEVVVEEAVVEGRHASREPLVQVGGLAAREGGLRGRDGGAHLGEVAVAVQAPRAVALGQQVDAAGGFEGGGGGEEELLGHGGILGPRPAAVRGRGEEVQG